MTELQKILAALQRSTTPAALATLVHVDGSSYRKPGARMLVMADGAVMGGLTAGCLEADIRDNAFQWTENGSCTKIFETGSPEDTFFGWGSGCKGTLSVLFERVDCKNATFASLAAQLKRRQSPVLATVYRVEGHSGQNVGDRFESFSASLRLAAERDIQAAQRDGKNRWLIFHEAQAELHVFIECIKPAIHLIIFGACWRKL